MKSREPLDQRNLVRSNGHELIDVTSSVLLVIDSQQPFLNKYDRAKTQALISKVSWLIGVAAHLDVPIVAMAEDIDRNGSLVGDVASALPNGTIIHNKDFFGLNDNPAIFSAVEKTGRTTAICVGMETDVCVMHSALGLLSKGYRVMTLQDAVATTEFDERIGIERMRQAGVMIGSVKSLFYEWMRSVSSCRRFDNLAPELRGNRPPDLVL